MKPVVVLANLSAMQIANRDLDGAAASIAEGLALQTKRLGSEHPQVAVTLAQLAVLEHARHRDDEARRHWEEVIRIRRAPDASARDLFEALYGFGVFLTDIGEHERSVQFVEEAIDVFRSQDQGDVAALSRAKYVLGSALARLGRRDAAVEHLKDAGRLFDTSPTTTKAESARVRRRLAELARANGE